MRITNCRSCGREDLRVILDLGSQPIANALLNAEELNHSEAKFDLAVAFCPGCALLRVTETVPADVLYGPDYPYFSSSSPALLKHSAEHVKALISRFGLSPLSFVVEVASNDGYLLRNFVDRGIPCPVSIRLTGLWERQTRLGCQRYTISSACDVPKSWRAKASRPIW